MQHKEWIVLQTVAGSNGSLVPPLTSILGIGIGLVCTASIDIMRLPIGVFCFHLYPRLRVINFQNTLLDDHDNR